MNSDCLITDYRFELVEDHHSAGSGRYHVRVLVTADISDCFQYLNAVMDDTMYDHENSILIGASNRKRYAFRPHEIQAGMVNDSSDAPPIAAEVVALVNRVWEERSQIAPTTRERQLPTVFSVYQTLPKTNCRQCGFPTCLAFAGELRNGNVPLENCPPLSEPGYASNREKLRALFL
jgi:ArsR family metal-binding transcriptional regulator